MRLAGKRVLITAAGQGIGRAIAEAYIAEGAEVFATDLQADLLAGLEGCDTAPLDVLDRAAIDAAVARARPDILLNCAGVVHAGTILDATDADLQFAFDLNVRAMMHTIQASLPIMQANKRGSIVNIASVASTIMGVPNRFVYGATKAAVIGLTKAVARDFIEEGIRCNCICPATVDSPSLHERLRATGDYEAAMKAFVARQPMGRIARSEEIASLAVYLGADESEYVTGQASVIDGGMTL